MSESTMYTDNVIILIALKKMDTQDQMLHKLPLQAAISAKQYSAVYCSTRESKLAGTQAGCTSDAQKAALKRNQDCFGIFITSFKNNPRLMAQVRKAKTAN